MKRFILPLFLFAICLCLLLLVLPCQAQGILPQIMQPQPTSGGGSAPTIYESAGCTNGSGTTCSITLPHAVPAGDAIFVFEGSNGNGTTPTMTGETFSTLTTNCTNNNGYEGDCYLAASAVGGQTVLNCGTAGQFLSCGAIVFTRPTGLMPIGDAGGSASISSTSFSVATSAATTNANDLCIGNFYYPDYTFTATGSFTLVQQIDAGGSNGGPLLQSQYTPSATGIQTATATLSSAASGAPAGVACFKP